MTKSLGKYFDSELVARIGKQELTARRIVDGFLAGKNRSSRHGFSVEFVEHREYSPGDDLRHLDWKVLGRMDRYYIKRYEEETNITVILMLDCSKSMLYGSDGATKFETAATAATGLGHLLSHQRDAVGLLLFDEDIRMYVPPSARLSGLANIVSKLQGTEVKGKSELEPIVRRISPELPGRCLFVLLSDLFVEGSQIDSALKLLQFQGHDCVVLHTLDKAEKEFPFRQNMLFRGMEDGRELLAEPQRLREKYLEALDEYLAQVQKTCERSAFDYQQLIGGEPLAPILSKLLALRARRGQVAQRGR
ncbi:MAG: DUF58 domain-containing protein [Planctomycetota bacterium]